LSEKQFYPYIYNYLRYRVDSVEDAEDLIGTVFEQAYAPGDGRGRLMNEQQLADLFSEQLE